MFNNTYQVFKLFDFEKASDFNLKPIKQVYEGIKQGKEVYFLNENNEPEK